MRFVWCHFICSGVFSGWRPGKAGALVLLAVSAVLTGCATARTIPYPYDDVASALKQRFVDKRDRFDHTKPKVSETKDTISISFDSNVDFNYAVSVKLTARRAIERPSECDVTAKIVEHLRDWEFRSRSEEMEKLFLECLEKRMKTGRWEEMPWRREEARSGFFPKLFN